MQSARDRLIVALDYSSSGEALSTVKALGNKVALYKVGLQLFSAAGPDVVRELVDLGKNVFLDLKLHDIPNTVSFAVRSICKLNVSMLTVHASGGKAMLQAAAAAAKESAHVPLVLAVTVLTSMDEGALH